MTKSGSNQFRGSAFEFFRDRSLNANNFFSNRNGQPKPILDQNQFGFTLGGPVVRDRLLFFGSYQGTRQTNGVSSLVTVLAPPLTDDRSAAAIGRLFAGQRGVQQNAMGGVGPAILADGSNINPIALRLLQMRLADGSYLIPTPQRVNPAAAFAVQGSSTFSTPSTFDENQYMANVDYVHIERAAASRAGSSPRSATREQAFPAGNVPGFPLTTDDWYVATLGRAQLGARARGCSTRRGSATACCRPTARRTARSASPTSGSRPSPLNDDLPTIGITGSYTLGSSAIGTRSQRTFLFEDSLSWVLGRHNVQIGGGFTRALRDFEDFRQPGALTFQSFPDFLLGLNAAQNGTNLFSNVFVSVDLTGQFDRASRNWETSAYVQDSFQVSSRLTVNAGAALGIPAAADRRDRPSDDGRCQPARIRIRPPPGRSRASSCQANYPGTIPAGVFQTDQDTIIDAAKTHTLGPRAGFDVAGARRLEPRGRQRRLRAVFLADDGTGADADHDDAAVRSAARVGRAAEWRRRRSRTRFPIRFRPKRRSRCSCRTRPRRT